MSSSNRLPPAKPAVPTSKSTEDFSYESPEHRWSPHGPKDSTRIRLLRLEPPSNLAASFPLQGSLFWVDLARPKPFTALSYVWGTGEKTSHITISGRRLAITPTLEVALQRIVSDSNPDSDPDSEAAGAKTEGLLSLLWVDQICVNQKDGAEKAEQVLAMDQIYSAATEVLIWLGDAADDSDVFMALFGRIGRWAESWDMLGYYTPEKIHALFAIMKNVNPDDALTRAYREFCEGVLPEFDVPLLRAMWQWQKRAWFSRVWVVQEFTLAHAPTLVCGGVGVRVHQMLLARQIFAMTIAGKLLDRGVESSGADSASLSQGLQAFLEEVVDEKLRVKKEMGLLEVGSEEGMEELELQLERLETNLEIEIFAKTEETSVLMRQRHARQESWQKVVTMVSQDPLQSFHVARKRRQKFETGTAPGDSLYRLLQTLYVSNDMQATVARDKVYGILSLATDRAELGIVVSYEKEISFDMIYARTARAVIRNGGVGLLNSAQSGEEEQEERLDTSGKDEPDKKRDEVVEYVMLDDPRVKVKLPSWVPDWRKNLQRPFAWREWEPSTGKEIASLFAAGGDGITVEVVDSEDELVLGLMGYKFDVIKVTASPWHVYSEETAPTGVERDAEAKSDAGDESSIPDDDTDEMDWANDGGPKDIGLINHEATLQFLESVKQICYSAPEQDAINKSLRNRMAEAIWRVPIGDLEPSGSGSGSDVRATASFNDAYEKCLISLQWFARESELPKSRRKYSLEDVQKIQGSADRYRSALDKMTGKRPFRTLGGYIGMGPLGMEAGDVVVVFEGAAVPFVVKSVGDGAWSLVGECFCYGAMDGEALEGGKRELFNLY